jgi:membrane-associated phospholipid phosphatase
MDSRSASISDEARARRARRLTLAGAGAYAAATAALVGANGLILSRDWLFAWLLVGLLALSLADPRRWVRGVVVDWLPLMAVLLCYDLSRPVREWVGVQPHVLPQLDADRWAFGEVPSITLQHALHDPGTAHWYDFATFFVYLSHFFVTLLVLALLWRFSYPRFRQYRTLVVALATAGFATYVLFPAVPPWLAAWYGHIEPVPRTIGEMWGHVGIQPAAALFENRGEFYNQEAAIPSLHAAYPMLLLLFLWRSGWWVRIGLAAYVLAMAFALVYTGEHYVSDVVVGWLFAGAVFAAAAWLRRQRGQREREGDLRPLAQRRGEHVLGG